MKSKKVFIAGAGGIGQAAGLILANFPYLDCEIVLADRYLSSAQQAKDFVNDGASFNVASAIEMPSDGMSEILKSSLSECDIILDCLPGSQAPRLATYAKDFGLHYANLTEYVKETEDVINIANNANTGFILQTGLAPGYINVLAMHLFNKFTASYGVEKVDEINMKVGALSKHARSPFFYAYTWSPIGVATEYVKDAYVVEDYQTKSIPSLSNTETILIDGIQYEDDFTSGGAADLPQALEGKVRNLNYKTIRFPGHYGWAKNIINETPADADPVDFLDNTMRDNIPSVEDDMVLVYASVKAKDNNKVLRAIEKSIKVYPSQVGNKTLRAIQTTTAAPLCEAARLLLEDNYKGPVLQSQLDSMSFLNGPFVKEIYGEIES